MLSDKAIDDLNKLATILSPLEVAAFCSCDRETIYRAISAGELKGWKDADGLWNILREDLRKFLSRRSN